MHVKNINAKQAALRNFSERAAINAPLQGTAADIIKRAMAAVQAFLISPAGKGARMLLQVHDELVIEAPEGEADTLVPNIKSLMEGAATLSIPLTVEVGIARNWGQT